MKFTFGNGQKVMTRPVWKLGVRVRVSGLVFLVLVAASCSGSSGSNPPGGGGGLLNLPKSSDGNPVLIQIGKSSIELTPTLKDPLTALGSCTDLITHCYDGTQGSLDHCIGSVARCDSNPLEALKACCPQSCQTAYQAARDGGTAEFGAFDQVFFKQPDCFPGVTAALGGN